jgi:hypothetical protein
MSAAVQALQARAPHHIQEMNFHPLDRQAAQIPGRGGHIRRSLPGQAQDDVGHHLQTPGRGSA